MSQIKNICLNLDMAKEYHSRIRVHLVGVHKYLMPPILYFNFKGMPHVMKDIKRAAAKSRQIIAKNKR